MQTKDPQKSPLSIFSYNDARSYFRDVLRRKQLANPRHSLRAWSRSLGYKTPSYLSEVLRGSRAPNLNLAQRIAKNAHLQIAEQRYLEFLVLSCSSRNDEEHEVYATLLRSLRPNQQEQFDSIDKFHLIADWYHLAILEAFSIRGVNGDPEVLAKMLGRNVTTQIVNDAIERLHRLGLIKKKASGYTRQSNPRFGDSIPSQAIREHHRQMLQLAEEAIDSQPMGVRQLNGSTIAVRKDDVPRLFELLRKAHEEIQKFSVPSDAECVYQINMQAFRIT